MGNSNSSVGQVNFSTLSAFFHPCARSCFPCKQGQNGSLIGSCDREKGNDHRDKIFGPRIHFFIVFFIFLQAFFAKANFFCKFFLLLNFFFFFREETNKFWCPEGGYNIVLCPEGWALLSRGIIFVLRAGPFEFFWWTKNEVWVNQKNSKGPARRTKIVPRDNKAQPEGH